MSIKVNKYLLVVLLVGVVGYGEVKLYQYAWKRGAIAAFQYIYSLMDQGQQGAISKSL